MTGREASAPLGGGQRSGTEIEIPAERLPAGFIDALAAPSSEPVTPVASATVVLLRRGRDGPETLLLRRSRVMGFVPGAYVFPGGRVDPEDAAKDLCRRWFRLTEREARERLGMSVDAAPPALAYFGAAVREAIEETGLAPGVVLEGGCTSAAEGDRKGTAMAEAREALLGGRASLSQVLEGLGARLDGAAIEYIAHWVTPRAEPRRYDTRFFAARVPEASVASHDEREMTNLLWLTPKEALRRHKAGRLPMIFPTIRTLEDLVDFETVDAVFDYYREREITRVQPEIVRTETGVALRL